MPNHTAAIQLCVQKLRILIEDSDQNLKYLGLLAMSQILKTNPKSVQGHKGQLISECLFGILNFPKKQRKIGQTSAPVSKN